MRRLDVLPGVIVGFLVLSLAGAVRADAPTAECSAFNRGGSAVAVSVVGGHATFYAFTSNRTPAKQVTSELADQRAYRCDAFFDDSGKLFVVGLQPIGPQRMARPLHILAFDLSARSVASSFDVPSVAANSEPWRLVGFLHGNASLVLLGWRGRKAFDIVTVGVDGTRTSAALPHELPPDGTSPLAVDAANDRFWFPHTPEWCPLRAAPLLEAGTAAISVEPAIAEAANFCIAAALAFPDANTIVAAFHWEPDDFIASLSISDGKGEELKLPKAYADTEGGTLSPDGLAFAAIRILHRNTPLEKMQPNGVEVDVVDLRTARLIGSVRLRDGAPTSSISVYCRAGAARVLAFVDDQWVERMIASASGGSNSATTVVGSATSSYEAAPNGN